MKIYPSAGDDKGEPIVKFHSLRSFLASLTTAGAALLLTSCGGGGAGGNPSQGGGLTILPATGTFYAGQVVTLTLSGGRRPYSLSSSEPGILPVPSVVNANIIQVIPNNPGVVDVGLAAGALPVRTVTLSLRDSTGTGFATGVFQVAQNFLTGYGVVLSPVTCPQPAAGAGTAPTACAGGTTAARLNAVINGALQGDRDFRYQVISGNFTVRDPVTNASGISVLLHSDHTGSVLGFIDVPANAITQLGVLRVIDVATGVYADQVFIISSSGANQGKLTAIPDTITFTGVTTLDCGTGTADVLVFDGNPPYTAISTFPEIVVSNIPSNTQPGRITITANNPLTCVNGSVVIMDSTGARVTVTVVTKTGSTTPPAPAPLAVSPTDISLVCGSTGSASVVGGTGAYSVSSSSPRVTAVVSGNTISISRLNADPAPPPGIIGGTSSVAVTDGATVITIKVTSPATCP